MSISRDELAAILAAFMLTDDEIAALAQLLYTQARVPAYSARYKLAAQAMLASLVSSWQPDKAALQRLEQLSAQDAQGIADTYHDDLEAQATRLVADENATASMIPADMERNAGTGTSITAERLTSTVAPDRATALPAVSIVCPTARRASPWRAMAVRKRTTRNSA